MSDCETSEDVLTVHYFANDAAKIDRLKYFLGIEISSAIDGEPRKVVNHPYVCLQGNFNILDWWRNYSAFFSHLSILTTEILLPARLVKGRSVQLGPSFLSEERRWTLNLWKNCDSSFQCILAWMFFQVYPRDID
jgi:hypothetical protein